MRFELLRTYPVDVLRYLPKFLKQDPSFKATQDSLSVEHEKLRLLIIDLCKQLFVESATWGLDDWERVYGITRDLDASYEQRRQAILTKIQGTTTITREQLETLINFVVPTKDAHVVENTAPNQFKVTLDTIVAIDEVRRVVNDYKPAHLTYLVGHNFEGILSAGIAGAVTVTRRVHLEQVESDNVITTEASVSTMAGAVAMTNIIRLHSEGGNI